VPVPRDKTDFLSGVLRGDAFQCRCKVALVTNLVPAPPGMSTRTSIQIASAEQTPPDGNYNLDIHGRVFKLRRQGGQWPTLTL
jgi:hypothetical protein